jgi:adenine-specific DNA-methyltransferase
MDGLLKDSPKSQLFTVFGQPEIRLHEEDSAIKVELLGVDIYSPLTGEITSSGANKVAAWFLDSDYDGRCFCITQAFFPNQKAWDKIAKALGSSADAEAFDAYNGTVSVPFEPGEHQRIAVKVIDPRGNEVMAIRSLKDAS